MGGAISAISLISLISVISFTSSVALVSVSVDVDVDSDEDEDLVSLVSEEGSSFFLESLSLYFLGSLASSFSNKALCCS